MRKFVINAVMKQKDIEEIEPLWDLNEIWSSLTYSERLAIQPFMKIVQYKKNEVIYRKGDKPDGVLTLVKGKVRIYIEGLGGKQQIIRLLKPYDFFGYRSAIAHDTHTTCASAFEDCTFYRVETEEFLHLVGKNNEFCHKLLVDIAMDLATSDMRQVSLTQKHLRGRLAEAIEALEEHYGLEEDGITLAFRISREDLANMSNMTTANAIRTLSQFVQEGVIATENKRIQILNKPELKKISRMG